MYSYRTRSLIPTFINCCVQIITQNHFENRISTDGEFDEDDDDDDDDVMNVNTTAECEQHGMFLNARACGQHFFIESTIAYGERLYFLI